MAEEKIVAALGQLQNITLRSKTARLRDLFDHVEALRRRGFSHQTIVETMKKHGLEFDLKTFEVTFYRIRRERADRLAQQGRGSLPAPPEPSSKPAVEGVAGTGQFPRNPLQKVAQQATQAELKAIARSHIDPNQFMDE